MGSKGSLRLALTSPLPGTWVQADTPNSGQTPAARLGRPVPCRAQACITPEACPSGRTAASAEPTLVTLSHSLRLKQSTARRRRVLRAASSPTPHPRLSRGKPLCPQNVGAGTGSQRTVSDLRAIFPSKNASWTETGHLIRPGPGGSLRCPRGWEPGRCPGRDAGFPSEEELGEGYGAGGEGRRGTRRPSGCPSPAGGAGWAQLTGRRAALGSAGGRWAPRGLQHLARAARLLPGAPSPGAGAVQTAAMRPRRSRPLGPTPCDVTSPALAYGTRWPRRKGAVAFFLFKGHVPS